MKKYLMTGIAALAMCAGFTSCSHDLSDPTQEDINQYVALKVTDNYNRAFIDHFGEPSEDQDWGFGTTSSARAITRANPGETYPATHSYTDANGNVIAGANMNHNQWGSTDLQSMPYGGWIVPDPLTEDQKERVRLYFQANPNLSYEDPHFRHFYVQQVYKGGTKAPQTGNKESTKDVNGTSYDGSNMNLLTVGVANSHINDFNNGTCTTSSVLNHEGKTQSDQITLMVNVYDTSCFGYHNTGASIQKNDKMALVSAATIDAWAAQNGNPGAAVVDKWNRSFMGFDFELKDLESAKDGSYARFDSGQNNGLQYVWDGTSVLLRGDAGLPDYDITNLFTKGSNGWTADLKTTVDFSPYTAFVVEFSEATTSTAQIDFEYGGEWGSWNSHKTYDAESGVTKIEFVFGAPNYVSNLGNIYKASVTGTDLKISKIYLKGKEGTLGDYNSNYLLINNQQVPFLSTNKNMYGGTLQTISDDDMKIEKDGKWCFNMAKITQLVNDGYLPVKDKNLREWVKWQGGDGYYSDWIVTLTEAQRNEKKEENFDVRIIAEDLTPGEDLDWDFNDVVFDITYTSDTEASCTIQCAGGVLPLRIATKGNPGDNDWIEVHEQYGNERKANGKYDMINTGGISITINAKPTFTVTGITKSERGKDIKIMVDKGTVNEPNWIEITANQGQPAAKIAVNKGYQIVTERTDIRTVYTKFSEWVSNPKIIWY